MTSKKKSDLEALILKLFERKLEISIHDVAQAAELSSDNPADRRAIQRVFKALVEQATIQAKGKARARVYALTETRTKDTAVASSENAFKDIPLSAASKELLLYLTKSIQGRTPVGYEQDFLRSYKPNQSSYLSSAEKTALLKAGQAENAVRPAGTYARNIFNRLLIDLSWNSSRLEGNTYSLLETQRLLELGEAASGKDASEAQMILNHKGAIEYILESAQDPEINSHTICSIHALLSENLLGDPSASGRLRQMSVGISGTTYLPLDNPHVLKECFDIFIKKLNQIEDPFEQSFFSLIHLSYMQAFEDVNKRTARLVANIPLIKKNLKPLSFTDVPGEAYVKALLGIYEKTAISLFKDLFVWAYQRSSQRYSAIQQSMGEPNLLKLKYRSAIQDIVRTIILEKVDGRHIVARIGNLIAEQKLPEADASQLFQIIETEILSLHDGNIARFKIKPSEFQEWKSAQ